MTHAADNHVTDGTHFRERELASQFSHFLQGLALHFGLSELLDTTVSLINTLAKLPEKLDKMVGN